MWEVEKQNVLGVFFFERGEWRWEVIGLERSEWKVLHVSESYLGPVCWVKAFRCGTLSTQIWLCLAGGWQHFRSVGPAVLLERKLFKDALMVMPFWNIHIYIYIYIYITRKLKVTTLNLLHFQIAWYYRSVFKTVFQVICYEHLHHIVFMCAVCTHSCTAKAIITLIIFNKCFYM